MLFHHAVHLAAEDGVDPIEVLLQRGQLRVRSNGLGNNPQIEADVRVHPTEQVLHDDRLTAACRIECDLPCMRRVGVIGRVEVPVECGEVAVGERDIEAFHPCVVLKHSLLQRNANGGSDSFVERREIAEAAFGGDRPVDDRINRVNHRVDRLCRRYRLRSLGHADIMTRLVGW